MANSDRFEINWKHPDYADVWQYRADNLSRIRSDKSILPSLKKFYASNPVQFTNDWGCTFDPRLVEIGVEAVAPFILFAKQEEFIEWVLSHWEGRRDALAEKSRDMGVSWLCVAVSVWMWLFKPGVVVGFGSRKTEYVDHIGDPKSLFWKIRQYIDLLPIEFRPDGWDSKKDAPFMRILNRENGSSIIGEAGDNIGRGNRTSIYFKDESAFYEQAELIDAALSQTSNCKIDVSTPNGNGNPFYQKRHSGRLPIFTFHWRDDPRKDEAWYEKQKNTLDPIVVAQEIDIDYNASTTDSWLPGSLVETAQQLGIDAVIPIGPLILGVDAAHFGNDESVLSPRRGRVAYDQIVYGQIDGHDLAARVIEWCERSPYPVSLIVIEMDGPGVSCYDTLRRSRWGEIVKGVHTGSRMSDSKNYNLRAKMYRGFRDWLADGPVRLPADKELKSQASSLKYTYKDGVLLMASKKDMKSKGFKSPDKSDALALTWAAEPDDSITGSRGVSFGHEAVRQKYSSSGLSNKIRGRR